MKKIRVFVVNLSKKNVLIRKFVRKSYILLKKLKYLRYKLFYKMDDKVIREHTNNKEEYEKYKGFGQLLHAKCIGFVHPVTHEYMEFERDVPEEFIKIEKTYLNH